MQTGLLAANDPQSVYLEWERKHRVCMDMIVDVASNYKRQKIGEVAAVRRIQEILDIVASSDSEEPVRCGNQIIVPPPQVLPRDQMMIVAGWLGILPAVVEDAGHGSGLL